MKKKRKVWFGIPVYVVRRLGMPLVLVAGLALLYFLVVIGNDSEYFVDLLIHDRWIALLIIGFPGLVPFVSVLIFYKRQNRYMKRFKRLGGRVCFVCDYEIAEGLDSCSECGARWCVGDLNCRWRDMAGQEG